MKRNRLLPCILALCMLLPACGREETPAQTEAVPMKAPLETTMPAVERKVITAVVPRHSEQTEQWWASFEQRYEADHPEFDLEVTCVSWHDIQGVIRDRIAAGNVPDLVNTDSFLSYQQQNLLLPVKYWVSGETYEKIYPALHKRATVDEKVWGIPDFVSARALYYNADILEAAGVTPPTTWRELITACQTLRIFDYDLIPWGVDMTTDEGYATFAYYVWNNGSDFTDDHGNWILDDPKNREAVEFITGMVNARLTNPDPTDQTRYDCQDLFGQGKIAMMIAPSSLPGYCDLDAKGIHYGIAPLPANRSNTPVSTATGNYLLCFAREGRSEAELAAITALVDDFYEDTTYSQWVQMEGFLPATTTANALLGKDDPHMAVWNQIFQNLKFYPFLREQWGDVKDGAVEVLQYTLWEGNPWLMLSKFQKNIAGG